MEFYSNEEPHDLKADEAIWDSFKRGDKQAYAELYQRYSKVLFRYCLRITGDRELVKDCIHDLFVTIWKNRDNLSQPDSVKAYLLSAIQRKLRRQTATLRSRQKDVDDISVLRLSNCREDQMIEDQTELEQKHIVSKALNALTKREREAVYLKFYSDLSYKEVAEVMSIRVDSIYNLISKSIETLHSELNKVSVAKL
ncbi:MAG TPA: sigma-70 family RNA polymerase sigma factor [Cyclobacteriaceae bacterium]|nr:sigma-70 family RNA polymerase sigma factor [Cyclobacteriaceae bacterium]